MKSGRRASGVAIRARPRACRRIWRIGRKSPSRTESSRAWEYVDRRRARRARDGFDSSPTAPRQIIELLRSGGQRLRTAEKDYEEHYGKPKRATRTVCRWRLLPPRRQIRRRLGRMRLLTASTRSAGSTARRSRRRATNRRRGRSPTRWVFWTQPRRLPLAAAAATYSDASRIQLLDAPDEVLCTFD